MLSHIMEGRPGGRPFGLALVAMLGLICLWLLVRLLATGLGAASDDSAPASVPMTTSLLAPPQESLARWHLFGSAQSAVDKRELAAVAPDSQQELQLVGLFAEVDPDDGVAFIADAAGRQAAYRVGAELPGGSRLRGVFADRVLLDRNGQQESLRLQLPPEGGAPVPGVAAPMARTSPAIPAAPMTSTPNIPGAESVDWAKVQRTTGLDPAELARQIRVLPVIENGAIVGMRISGGTAAPMIAKLGLQPDDIVTSVNGIPVRDVSRAQDVIASVRDADSVRVTVRRNGQEQTLNVDMK